MRRRPPIAPAMRAGQAKAFAQHGIPLDHPATPVREGSLSLTAWPRRRPRRPIGRRRLRREARGGGIGDATAVPPPLQCCAGAPGVATRRWACFPGDPTSKGQKQAEGAVAAAAGGCGWRARLDIVQLCIGQLEGRDSAGESGLIAAAAAAAATATATATATGTATAALCTGEVSERRQARRLQAGGGSGGSEEPALQAPFSTGWLARHVNQRCRCSKARWVPPKSSERSEQLRGCYSRIQICQLVRQCPIDRSHVLGAATHVGPREPRWLLLQAPAPCPTRSF